MGRCEMNAIKEVLDPCCGSKMFYFDKKNPKVLFRDCRKEEHILCDGRKLHVNPDEIGNFKDLPYPDRTFQLIIFDPPHLKQLGKSSWMRKKYGVLPMEWEEELKKGFLEVWRCLNTGGTLIFKWNETQIPLKKVLALAPATPLCGHTTTINLKTHWIIFYKPLLEKGSYLE